MDERKYGRARWTLATITEYGGAADCCKDLVAHIRELQEELAQERACWPRVDMGFGKFAVGECVDSSSGVPGVIYLRLPEARAVGTDCSDLFEIGGQAPSDSIAAAIHFHSAEALQQSIDVLVGLQSTHYAAAPKHVEGE